MLFSPSDRIKQKDISAYLEVSGAFFALLIPFLGIVRPLHDEHASQWDVQNTHTCDATANPGSLLVCLCKHHHPTRHVQHFIAQRDQMFRCVVLRQVGVELMLQF
jgi:hypothetical protein